ncbi:hypothetical protein ACFQI7_02470 [Paenibacillus allorhizosphaerae]|uniref:Uncharacterized protein n=1 Tax=Paenibacillus allorhizosphaerae TaxID=2849866 RepID=A0ABM8VAZ1_9BACL|nr:hypothetical protein [Paenibacillus allorhizosphaerae]CAG7617826.1 hypothetical protein PAECIP111802_00455 [Paenibacillus allorhizosphaerae]
MVVMNAIMLMISIAVLSTIRMMRGTFRPLEKMVYYMVITVAIEQTHSAIIDNLKLIRFSESVSAFFFFKMNQIIVFPIVTLWLLHSFFAVDGRTVRKTLLAAVWFLALSGSYFLFEVLGIFQLKGWKLLYSFAYWLTVLTESFCFAWWFRKLLRKRERDDPVSA